MSQTSSVIELRQDMDELDGTIETEWTVLQDLRSRPQHAQNSSKLAAAIKAKRTHLRDLISRSRQARHKLNLCVDPMARLPLELQSLIFLRALPVVPLWKPAREHNTLGPMVFLNICRLWRDIALATPKLWCDIIMDLPLGSNYSKLCEVWLRRARTMPLSVGLHGSMILQQDVLDLLVQYRHQLEHLTLFLSCARDSPRPGTISFGLIEGSCLPSLKTLSVDSDSNDSVFFAPGEWLKLWRAAPNLSSLSIQNTFHGAGVDSEDDGLFPPITLPPLNELRLGNPKNDPFDIYWEDRGSSVVLKFLTLPALHNLSLSFLDISAEAFISFLARSSAPLRSLDFAIPRFGWPVSEALRLIPTLTDLRLSAYSAHPTNLWNYPDRFLSFLQAMNSNPDLLPNLQRLTLLTCIPIAIDYQQLLRMLTMHSKRLQCFKLCVYDFHSRSIDASLPNEVRSALLQLAGGGMKIHITIGSEYEIQL
ncbi:hypothetical protein R3P38DRAFT_3058258 [Favolaschia claudopus]|uniref:F-box domain-containing protein n=1 Tax=Favolaschia claudopus TaxID=2862362 RepID=A0AAW0A2K1_9AGAR